MDSENKMLTRRLWDELWTQRRLEVIGELFTPDVVLHLSGRDLPGRTMIAPAISAVWFASFPDLTVRVEDQIAEGDKVLDRLIISGRHAGAPYQGLPAAGRPFRFTQSALSRIKSGRIAEMWIDLDLLGLSTQLGASLVWPDRAESGV